MINILATLENLLNDDMKDFAISLFFDTRIKQSLSKQVFIEPLGFAKAVKFVKDMGDSFVDAVRVYDKVSNKVASKMVYNKDPVFRIALWTDYLANGLE